MSFFIHCFKSNAVVYNTRSRLNISTHTTPIHTRSGHLIWGILCAFASLLACGLALIVVSLRFSSRLSFYYVLLLRMANEPIIYTVHVEALMIDNKFVVLSIRVHNGNSYISFFRFSQGFRCSSSAMNVFLFLLSCCFYFVDFVQQHARLRLGTMPIFLNMCVFVCLYVHIFSDDKCNDCCSTPFLNTRVCCKNRFFFFYVHLYRLSFSINKWKKNRFKCFGPRMIYNSHLGIVWLTEFVWSFACTYDPLMVLCVWFLVEQPRAHATHPFWMAIQHVMRATKHLLHIYIHCFHSMIGLKHGLFFHCCWSIEQMLNCMNCIHLRMHIVIYHFRTFYYKL